MPTIDDHVTYIENWAEEKNIHKADSSRQMLKVMEEVGETAAALARGNTEDLQDGIGDVFVTLVILAQQNGLAIDDCIAGAWEEIADRTGEVRDGVFIKSSDL